ncbi:hypothetical protein [Virgibacillus necropolis]|uniref:Uncharacterized protein n=1 Tax=Virgibacillus necropolis TaxID=163877 RepID=A0A221MFI8_9BACI|nr:hypothetical protein [Virgibacillus necropolis]ASN06339.1 hypothetical protein CFK40_15585 [Virgibacillus necropolis]
MSDKILDMFSQYELKARIFPALLIVAPFGLTILMWYPSLISLESSFITILVLVIILFFLAKIARENGKKVQQKLLDECGEFPSTTFLKHTDNTLNENTKKRYHQYLSKNVEGIQLPTKEQELESPNFYNDQYNSAVHWLLEKTRDNKKYSLLYQDNINYGFSRNMLGIKPLGIFFSFISIAINIFGIYQKYEVSLINLPLKVIISFLISIIFISMWTFFVKKDWVRSTSKAYARTLLSTCEGR